MRGCQNEHCCETEGETEDKVRHFINQCTESADSKWLTADYIWTWNCRSRKSKDFIIAYCYVHFLFDIGIERKILYTQIYRYTNFFTQTTALKYAYLLHVSWQFLLSTPTG